MSFGSNQITLMGSIFLVVGLLGLVVGQFIPESVIESMGLIFLIIAILLYLFASIVARMEKKREENVENVDFDGSVEEDIMEVANDENLESED